MPFEVRLESSDVEVIWDTAIAAYHRPPSSVSRSARLIFDLGANIGATAADFAIRFPEARIVAVELDHETAELCRRNTKPWADRIEMIEAALWNRHGTVSYAIPAIGHYAAAIGAGDRTAEAVTMGDLIASSGGGPVDFLKMDIEGAEREVLADARWGPSVRTIYVELHGDFTVDDCLAALEKMGFTATRDTHHWNAVLGVRP